MNGNYSFSLYDWATMGCYGLVLLLSGLWLGRKKQAGTEDYFLAGRAMPAWAVAVSILATSLSAATFIGAPEQAYRGDLTYLTMNVGAILGAVFVALVLLPAFYRYRVATVYEFLERRFGTKAKVASSWTFMIGRVFASGARIFIAALPASLILFGDLEPAHVWPAIAALTLAGVLYTLAGGVRSIIWSDVIQAVVFVGAAVAACWLLLQKIPLSIGEIVTVLGGPSGSVSSKLTVIDLGLDLTKPGLGFNPSARYTLLTALTGLTLLNIGAYGTDQDLAQRMLTCRSAKEGSWSVISGILVQIPVIALFLAIGSLLSIFYLRPDLMGAAAPSYTVDDSRQIFLSFILEEMPAGMPGFMMAGLFAAGLSSLNSALNAMASSFVNDWYRNAFPGQGERHYLRVGRCAVAGWGVVLGGFAMVCVYWQQAAEQSLIDFSLSVMTFAYAGLVAVFLTAALTSRGNGASVVLALASGFCSVLLLQPRIWRTWAPLAWQPLRIAFPWQLLIATAIATAVCCLGRREARRAS